MSTVAKLLARLELDTSGFAAQISGIHSSLGSVGSSMTNIGGLITRGVTLPLTIAAAATVALAADAVKTGADFEKAMRGVGAIVGGTTDDIKALSDEALRLGMDPHLIVSASQAAGVMEELAKNGLTMQQIMGGAAEGAIALANATGTDFATSAQIASTSMALFNIDAKDMAMVVNQVTAVANESRFTAEDFAQAIGMGGAAAKAAGVPFEEFAATITALSTATSSGSDAGTSYKTFLTRLVPITEKAGDTMKELGIITEDGSNQFFDAAGNIKSMAEIAGVLDKALSDMSAEERIPVLHEMFGTDASRAAIGLMEIGEQGFKDLMTTMAQTDAAENAATRMDNLAGAMEILSGIAEGFKIKFTQALGPGIRSMVESFSNFLTANSKEIEHLFVFLAATVSDFGKSFGPWLDQNGPKMILFFEKMIAALPDFIAKLVEIGTVAAPFVQKLFDAFMNADPEAIAKIISSIAGLAVLGPIMVVVGGIITGIASLITIITTIAGAFSGLGTIIATVVGSIGAVLTGGIVLPLLVIIGTLALVVYAFATDFAGITTTVMQLGSIIKMVFGFIVQSAVATFTSMANAARVKFTEIISTVMKVRAIFEYISSSVSNAIQRMIVKVGQLASSLLRIKLPSFLKPGSPTPFEIGLLGISNAMEKINRTGLSGITAASGSGLSMPSAVQGASNTGATSGSGSNVTVNIQNPKKETSEESIRKTLNNLSYLGVLK